MEYCKKPGATLRVESMKKMKKQTDHYLGRIMMEINQTKAPLGAGSKQRSKKNSSAIEQET